MKEENRVVDPLALLLERYVDDEDEAAMTELVAATRPELVRTAKRIAGAASAEDAVQAAYLALVRQRQSPRELRVMAWLVAVTTRRAYRARALAMREHLLAERLQPDAGSLLSPDQIVAGDEERMLLLAELDRLPASLRDPVVLHHLQGLTTREVAQLLNVPHGTVCTRLARARDQLRSRLAPRLRLLILAAPWLLADVARAAPVAVVALLSTGGLMKAVSAIAVAFLLVVGALVVWINSQSPQRVEAPGASETGAVSAESMTAQSRDAATAPSTDGARADGAAAMAAGEVAASDPDEAMRPVLAAGRVVDAAGAALAGARLLVYRPESESRKAAWRSEHARAYSLPADGAFELRDLPAESSVVRAEVEGYCDGGDGQKRAVAGDMELVLKLQRCAVLGGIVRGPDMAPMPGATVEISEFEVSPGSASWRTEERSTTSDASGAFRFAAAPTGRVEVVASVFPRGRMGDAPASTDLLDDVQVIELSVGDSVLGLEFILDRGMEVSGRVFDQQGNGVAQAAVEASQSAEGMSQRPVRRASVTDDSGAFKIVGLMAGKVRLQANHPDYHAMDMEYASLNASAGDQGLALLLTRGCTLTGVVQDESGRAPAGARVTASPSLAGMAAPSDAKHGIRGQFSATCDADGRFTFSGLPIGDIGVFAGAPGHCPSPVVTVTLAAGAVAPAIEVICSVGLEISGHIVDEARQPINDVEVRVEKRRTGSITMLLGESDIIVEKGSEGAFIARGLVADADYEITLKKQGWMQSATERARGFRGGERGIVLTMESATGRVRGHVRDEAGRGIAAIVVGRLAAAKANVGGDPYVRSAGDDGAFDLMGLPAGRLLISASSEIELEPASIEVEMSAGGLVEGVLLVFKALGTVTGSVIDQDGAPVVGVMVSTQPMGASAGSMQSHQATSSADGTFTLTGVQPSGSYLSIGVPSGYEVISNESFNVRPGEHITVRMKSGLRLRGRLIDVGGEPVKSARVFPCRSGPIIVETTRWYDVGSLDGRFELGASRRTQWLWIEAPRFARATVMLDAAALRASGTAEGFDLGDIVLVSGHELVVRVVTADDVAIARARVTLDQLPPLGTASGSGVFNLMVVSDEAGLAHFRGLAAATYRVRATSDTAGHGENQVKLAAASESPMTTTIQLQAGGNISGRVRAPGGAGAAGVAVQIQSEMFGRRIRERSHENATTDHEGRFAFTNLPPGEYAVSCTLESGAGRQRSVRATVVVRSGETTACELGGRDDGEGGGACDVVGKLEGFAGANRPSAWSGTLWLSGGGLMLQAPLAADGAFEFADVPPGQYDLQVERAQIRIDIPDQERAEITVSLPRTLVAGRVRRADGASAAATLLLLEPAGGALGQLTRLETDDTSFELRYLKPGDITLIAEIAGFGRSAPIQITLAPDQQLTGLDLVVHAGGELRVRVAENDGRPCTFANIAAADSGGRVVRGLASEPGGAAGEFVLSSLPLGNVRIFAGDDAHGTGWLDLVVGATAGVGNVPVLHLPANGARFQVAVTRAGAPVDHRVRIRDDTGQRVYDLSGAFPLMELTGDSGRPSASGLLPAGSYRIEIIDDAGKIHERALELVAGAPVVEIAISVE